MTIMTRSKFYYIEPVTASNYRIDFDEGSGELTEELQVGTYSMTELMSVVASALNIQGTQEYTVSLDRNTRLVTISAPSNFDLLAGTGSSGGTNVYPLIGFTNGDLTGNNSYTSDTAIGSVYFPQFILQNYVDADNFQEAVGASVNESASGVLEVLSFGNRSFYEFNIKYINDYSHTKSSYIVDNPNGVLDARNFMVFIKSKSALEFMPDKDNSTDFKTVILESTSSNKEGVGFKLKELVGQGLAGYFETGRLKFRRV